MPIQGYNPNRPGIVIVYVMIYVMKINPELCIYAATTPD